MEFNVKRSIKMVLYYSFLLDSVEVGDPILDGSGYLIDGTEVEHTRLNNEGDGCTIVLSESVVDVKTPLVGQSVIISRGETTSTDKYIFRGNVKEVKFENNSYKVLCRNHLHALKYKLLTISYDKNTDTEAGEYSAIFSDIITRAGLTPSVVASGTGTGSITADKFISNKKTYLNRLNSIAVVLNWFFYEDYDEEWIRLEPKGYVDYETVLTVGTNVVNYLKWSSNFEPVRNNITIEGFFEEDTEVLSETGNGITTTFFFGYTPIVTNCDIDGTQQVRGISGVTETYDYTVDVDKKSYTFVTAPAIGEVISMNYSHKILSSVSGKNSSSIDTYDLEQEESFRFEDIFTVDDAENRLSQFLNALGTPISSTTAFVTERDVRPGMRVQVVDASNTDFNGFYIVERVKMKYGLEYDVVDIGIPRFKPRELLDSINERLNDLKGTGSDFNEIIRQLIQLFHNISYERDNVTGEKRDKGLSFIFDDPDSEFDDGVHLFDWQGDAWEDFVNTDY